MEKCEPAAYALPCSDDIRLIKAIHFIVLSEKTKAKNLDIVLLTDQNGTREKIVDLMVENRRIQGQ